MKFEFPFWSFVNSRAQMNQFNWSKYNGVSKGGQCYLSSSFLVIFRGCYLEFSSFQARKTDEFVKKRTKIRGHSPCITKIENILFILELTTLFQSSNLSDVDKYSRILNFLGNLVCPPSSKSQKLKPWKQVDKVMTQIKHSRCQFSTV